MSEDRLEDMLTPSAVNELDNWVGDLRHQVIAAATRQARAAAGDVREISLRDILDVIRDSGELAPAPWWKNRRQSVLLVVVGVTLTAAGLLISVAEATGLASTPGLLDLFLAVDGFVLTTWGVHSLWQRLREIPRHLGRAETPSVEDGTRLSHSRSRTLRQ